LIELILFYHLKSSYSNFDAKNRPQYKPEDLLQHKQLGLYRL